MKNYVLVSSAVLTLALSACGGGSSSDTGGGGDATGVGGSGTSGSAGKATGGSTTGKGGSGTGGTGTGGATGGTTGKGGSAGTAGAAGGTGATGGAATGGNAGKAGSAGGAAGTGAAGGATGGMSAGGSSTGGSGTGGSAGGATGGTGATGGSAAGGSSAGKSGSAGTGTGGSSGTGGSGTGGSGATGGSGTGGSTGGSAGSGGGIVVNCTTTSDCAGNPVAKLCNTGEGKCAGCLLTPTDTCPANQYCAQPSETCAVGCKDDNDCSGGTPHCDVTTHSCKQCITDPECPLGSICAPGGTCAPGCSASQTCPGSQTCCGTSCHDTANGDLQNCGGCGKVCAPHLNAATTCTGNKCGMGACAAGFADCNGDPTDGCEVNTALQGSCVCKPGVDTQGCYYGPAGTQNKGICKGGTSTCAADGLGYNLDCNGQVLPEAETCSDGIDHNCDGAANNVPDIDGDGWTACNGDCCETTAQCGSPKLVNPGAVDVIGSAFPDADCNGKSDPVGFDFNGAACVTAQKFTGVTTQDMLAAIELCRTTTANPALAQKIWGVVKQQLLLADGSAPAAADLTAMQNYQAAILTGYGNVIVPRKAATMLGMSTGRMRDKGDPNYVIPVPGTGFTSAVNPPTVYTSQHGGGLLPGSCGGTTCSVGTGANDSINLRTTIRVPTNANSFSYDFRFFSGEYQSFQCTPYNDYFLALLTSGAAGIPADHNISFDKLGHAVSVNNGFFEVCGGNGQNCGTCPNGTGDLAGTGMEAMNGVNGGGTTWLTTNSPIVPGETMVLDLTIFDVSDNIYDSLVLVDNFQWSAAAISGPGTGHSPLDPVHQSTKAAITPDRRLHAFLIPTEPD